MPLYSVFLTDLLTLPHSMSTMLGKGANCALLDSLSLAEALEACSTDRRLSIRDQYRQLCKFSIDNVERRKTERKRSALVQNLVYLGENKVLEYCREHSLKLALGWVGGDPHRSEVAGF
jgi:2-polyprenyl-6-methoxyphenol hydroxylase-like FAD-dependent oxidoreductase